MNSHSGEPTSAIEMNSDAAQDVADDHDLAAVEPVREQAAERARTAARQQLGEHDAGEREALRLVALGQLGDQPGQREQ